MKKILVIAPHPDDEVLGCGGTILRHKKNGDMVYCAYVTNFKKNYFKYKNKLEQIKKVSKKLKLDDYFIGEFHPTELNEKNLNKVILFIKKIVNKIKPETIFVPFEGDIHTDHKIVFDACKPFIKSFRYKFIKNFYVYEILSETNFSEGLSKISFKPNLFVDITKFIKEKIKIAYIYKDEFYKHPFPRSSRSIKSLAILRGSFSNQKYSESFMIIKKIQY